MHQGTDDDRRQGPMARGDESEDEDGADEEGNVADRHEHSHRLGGEEATAGAAAEPSRTSAAGLLNSKALRLAARLRGREGAAGEGANADGDTVWPHDHHWAASRAPGGGRGHP